MIEERQLYDLIDNEYLNFEQTTDAKARLTHINTIIEANTNCTLKKYDTYRLVKKYIESYTSSINDEKFDYDKLDNRKLYIHFGKLNSYERHSLAIFTERCLHKHRFYEELPTSKKLTQKYCICKTFHKLLSTKNPKYIFLLASKTSTYNLATILLSFLIIFAVTATSLLPSENINLQLFLFTTKEYTNNSTLNHIINSLCLLFSIDSDIKIKPLNTTGVIYILLYKIFIIIFVLNIFLSELIKKIRKQ